MQARVKGRIARGQYLGRLATFKSNECVVRSYADGARR